MNVDVQEKRPQSNREQEIDETLKTLYLSLLGDQNRFLIKNPKKREIPNPGRVAKIPKKSLNKRKYPESQDLKFRNL